MHLCYPATALQFDPGRESWRIDPDFGAEDRLWRIGDQDGVTVLTDGLGRTIRHGAATATGQPVLLRHPDGGVIRLDRLILDGGLCLYLPPAPLDAELAYAAAAPGHGRAVDVASLLRLPWLGGGAMVATDDGLQPVDWLRPGDRVLTRDNGYQRLLWLGKTVIPRHCPPEAWPRTLTSADLGTADLDSARSDPIASNGAAPPPARDLLLGPGQRVLLTGPNLQLWFGESETFAPAGALGTPLPAIRDRIVMYHLLFAAPEVFLADGVWLASVQADADYLQTLPAPLRAACGAQLLTAHATAARAVLEGWELTLVRQAHGGQLPRMAA